MLQLATLSNASRTHRLTSVSVSANSLIKVGIPFSSWLFRIAKSELYQSFRDKKARRTVSIDSMQIGKVMEEFQIDESEHKREVLLKVLPLLKESQLQLIEMRFFEKRSFREMGEILDLTENNAKVKTFRALIKLKELYSKTNNIKN